MKTARFRIGAGMKRFRQALVEKQSSLKMDFEAVAANCRNLGHLKLINGYLMQLKPLFL